LAVSFSVQIIRHIVPHPSYACANNGIFLTSMTFVFDPVNWKWHTVHSCSRSLSRQLCYLVFYSFRLNAHTGRTDRRMAGGPVT